MRLGLSSAAAPDASLDELLVACRRRGLDVLELGEGDRHGIRGGPDGIGGAEARQMAADAGVALVGFRSSGVGDDLRVARLAAAAEAPVLVGGDGPVAARVERALDLAASGADAAIVVTGEAVFEDLGPVTAAGLDVAWDAAPEGGGLGAVAEWLLAAAGDRLRHIRVLGSGPEAVMQEGRGVGELMARLALGRYRGCVVLAPSSPRYRVAWQHWLGRRGGWGCGSRTADPSLVRLGPALPAGKAP